jgi:hypothetical protein
MAVGPNWWTYIVGIVKKWGPYVDQMIPPAEIYGEITLQEVDRIMPKKWISKNHIVHMTRQGGFDAKYKLTTVSEIKRFLAWDQTNNARAYSLEDFDCDDFSFVLTGRMRMWTGGLAQGILIIPGHAKNFFIDRHKKVYEIEPQSDRISLLSNEVVEYII